MPKKKKKSKPSGLRKYWPHLTLKQAAVERQKMFDAQNGCCAICKRPETDFKRKLAVDHNHKTGKIRGLLCFYCNRFIVGRFDHLKAQKLLDYFNTYDNMSTPL